MSNWREQLSDESETKAVAAWLTEYYHIPTLAFLIGFIFWNRIRNWSNFVFDGEVFYTGNDPWYHYRSTRYVTENGLSTMPFDPWTQFPLGTSAGQFGTIFDQMIGFVALLVGLGNPSESLLRHVFLLAPPFFAVLICIPAYLIGRRMGGRFGGVVTVAFVALAPDRLLQMTLAGHVQHHSAEVLFMSLGMLGVMVGLSVVERELPVYELLAAGEIDELRGTLGWSLLAGVAMALYLWAWPPGVWIFGILGVFFVIHLSWEHVRGRSPEHAAFVGAVSLLTAGLLQLIRVQTFELGVTSRSLLQPGLAFAVAGGVVFLAWLSREVEARDVSRYAYPGIVAGVIALSAGLMALLLPDLFSYFFNQVDRVLGFVTSPGEAAGTIGEAQPPSDRADYLYSRYGLGAVTATIGAVIVFGRQVLYDEPNGEQLLLVVWAAFMVAATFTQVRFGYYLTIPIGALNAILAGFLLKTIGTPTDQEFTIETYQVLTVALVLLVMFVPLLGLPYMGVDATATDKADRLSQPGDILGWEDSLEWLDENTPEPGQYANPDGEPMDNLGVFAWTDDYEYPDGAYGVLSWWDYGHWITTQGERIPNANPFQEGATEAAEFLLAQDEAEALQVLEEEFDENENAKTRYVMIDWLMAESESQVGGKYFAPAQFHPDYDRSDFYQRIINPEAQLTSRSDVIQNTRLMAHTQRYYDSMLTRLYQYHGSSKDPEAVGIDRTVREEGPVEVFDNVSAAQEWADEFDSRQVGGVGQAPAERVEALEHFRLVHMSDVSAVPGQEEFDRAVELAQNGVNFNRRQVVQRDIRNSGLSQGLAQQALQEIAENPENASEAELQQARARAQAEATQMVAGSNPAWTKTFERVDGATIEGEGPANQTVRLSVEMDPANGQPFLYEQQVDIDESGSFSTTVPYSTTGYDEVSVEEGYTNVSVRANSSYTIETGLIQEDQAFVQYTATADVTERQVVGTEDTPVTVELEREVLFDQSEDNGEGDGEDGTSEEGGQDTSDGSNGS